MRSGKKSKRKSISLGIREGGIRVREGVEKQIDGIRDSVEKQIDMWRRHEKLKLEQGHGRETDYASMFCQKGAPQVTTEGGARYFPTQYYGKMSFMSNDPRDSQDYVVMSHDSNPAKVRFMMEHHWGLKRPNLLISVAGGSIQADRRGGQHLHRSNLRLEAMFRRGLVRIAAETNAWVIDGGADSGVSAMVGKAVNESYAVSVPVIGICAWGVVAHQECLHIEERCLTSDGQKVARYRKKKNSFGEEQRRVGYHNLSPDPNHTHFIFVDDGETGKYGAEVQFRAKIERAIAQSSLVWHDKGAKIIGADFDSEHGLSGREQQLLADLGDDRWRPANKTASSSNRKDIPAVVLCYGGGYATIDTCFQAVKLGTPVVFTEGSGRCADVFVAAVDHWAKVLRFVAEEPAIHNHSSPSPSYRNLQGPVNDDKSDGFIEDVEVCRLIAKKERELATLMTTVEQMAEELQLVADASNVFVQTAIRIQRLCRGVLCRRQNRMQTQNNTKRRRSLTKLKLLKAKLKNPFRKFSTDHLPHLPRTFRQHEIFVSSAKRSPISKRSRTFLSWRPVVVAPDPVLATQSAKTNAQFVAHAAATAAAVASFLAMAAIRTAEADTGSMVGWVEIEAKVSGDNLAVGATVKVVKEGKHQGKKAKVLDLDWNGLIKVELDGKSKSYKGGELISIVMTKVDTSQAPVMEDPTSKPGLIEMGMEVGNRLQTSYTKKCAQIEQLKAELYGHSQEQEVLLATASSSRGVYLAPIPSKVVPLLHRSCAEVEKAFDLLMPAAGAEKKAKLIGMIMYCVRAERISGLDEHDQTGHCKVGVVRVDATVEQMQEEVLKTILRATNLNLQVASLLFLTFLSFHPHADLGFTRSPLFQSLRFNNRSSWSLLLHGDKCRSRISTSSGQPGTRWPGVAGVAPICGREH
jgi:hypothetical protein